MTQAVEKKIEETPAYKAGQEARGMNIPLARSAIKNLRIGSDRYEWFLAGYDAPVQKKG